MPKVLNIAIDGPAGSGKSTVAKMLSENLKIEYINTGAMYRAVTLLALENNLSDKNVTSLVEMLQLQEFMFQNGELFINGVNRHKECFRNKISQKVSFYSRIPEIRIILSKKQQEMSKKISLVMEGRDIGTVVLPKSKNKFFLEASVEVRARRRYQELLEKGEEADYQKVEAEIINRDKLDSEREHSPLVIAKEARVIDTSQMSINEVVKKIEENIYY
jgi:CMP/dCMP kinase